MLKKYLNTLLVVLPFAVCWFAYYEALTLTTDSRKVTLLMLAVYTIAFYWLCHNMDGFRFSTVPLTEMIFNQMVCITVVDFFTIFVIWPLSNSIHFPNVLPILLALVAQLCIIPFICTYRYRAYYKNHPPLKALIVNDMRDDVEKLIEEAQSDPRFTIAGVYNVKEMLSDLSLLDKGDLVFLLGVHSSDRNVILKECTYRNIQLYIIPRVGDLVMSATEDMHMLHLPILRSTRYNPTVEYRFIKRLFDLLFALIALVLLSPIFLVLAIAIHKDGGPVFYKQVRLTQNGREFNILKFRSMCVDAEKYSGAVLSSGENDPRITKVGKFIRACRLDEVPQLINILKGDMSIVGPRPERPEIAREYEKTLPEFSLRLQAKAGLTGYAQVYGKYNSTPYDKLLMDLIYIAHPSLFEDMKIILETIRILFDKESTEGVTGKTAMKEKTRVKTEL